MGVGRRVAAVAIFFQEDWNIIKGYKFRYIDSRILLSWLSWSHGDHALAASEEMTRKKLSRLQALLRTVPDLYSEIKQYVAKKKALFLTNLSFLKGSWTSGCHRKENVCWLGILGEIEKFLFISFRFRTYQHKKSGFGDKHAHLETEWGTTLPKKLEKKLIFGKDAAIRVLIEIQIVWFWSLPNEVVSYSGFDK